MKLLCQKINFQDNTNSNSSAKGSLSKIQIIKNLLVLGLAFLLSFCASEGWAHLQSTVNSEKGVGVISMSVQYACGCICALFLPKYLIKKFGSKKVIMFSMLSYVPYLASNFYPHFSFMMPTSIIVGFASSLIWGSLGVYLNELSSLYSNICIKIAYKNTMLRENNDKEDKPKASPSICNSIRKHKDSISISRPCFILEESSFQIVDLDDSKINTDSSFIKKVQIINESDLTEAFHGPICLEKPDYNKGKRHKKTLNDYKSSKKLSSVAEKPALSSPNDHYLPSILTSISEKINSIDSIGLHQENGCQSEIDLQLKSIEKVTSRFFGVFGFIYLTSNVWSNLISYSILERHSEDVVYMRNSSCACGANFCTMNSVCFQHNLHMPSDKTRYILATVYVVMGLLSVLLVSLFLDEIRDVKTDVTFTLNTVLATFRLHKQKQQLLIFPLYFFIGMMQAFTTSDFNKDFVGCAWGISHVALVNICGGFTGALGCCLSGLLEKHMGRRLIFLIVALLNIAVNVTMLVWTPDSNQPEMMLIVCGILGIVLGTMWCQVRAFIGIIFESEKEAAFGSYQFWHALGLAVCFAYSNYICSYIKIYILLVLFIVASAGYLFVEYNHSSNKRIT